MPAIHPTTLKKQIEDLLDNFHSSELFINNLRRLFYFYSDRTRRSIGSSAPSSLVRSYNPPRQVSKQIEIVLKKKVESEPETGIALADNLWKESWVECRSLAFKILGWISPNPSIDIYSRLKEWLAVCGHDRAMDTAFAIALIELWRRSPDLLLSMLESWLTSSDHATSNWGLRVVQALSSDLLVDHLPIIFHLLTPYMQSVTAAPDTDLFLAVKNLAEKIPQETAFFLRRNLTSSENEEIFTLIRQTLDSFSTSTQRELLDFLHQIREESGEY
jgi:hypothetical protein